MMLKCFVMLLIGVFAGQACMGQQKTILFNHLGVNNGLSQGVNNCVFKDSRGYVWISSYDGLNRYDGLSYTIFRERLQEPHSIRGTLFLNIMEDRMGNLWIGSNKGLNFYNRSSNLFENFQMSGRRPEEQVFSPFYIDNNDRVWFQSGSDILLFDPLKKSFRIIDHFPRPGNLVIKTVPAVPFLPLQTLFCTVNNHAQAYRGAVIKDSIAWKPLFTEESYFGNLTFLLPVNGGLWMGSELGLLYFSSGSTHTFIKDFNGVSLSDIKSMTIDKKGLLWVGTLKKGLFAVDTLTKTIIGHYIASSRNPYALSGNQVQYLYADNENQLWVSIWGKGIDFASLEKFRFSHFLSGEETEQLGVNNFIRSIVESNGQLWCGTQQSGILVLDKEKHIADHITAGLPPAIEHLYKDSKGLIWVSTFTGLYIIDPASKKVKPVVVSPTAKPEPGRQFNFITETTRGDLLASSNAGLFLVHPGANGYIVTAVKGLPEKEVYLTSYCDSTGMVYISKALKGFSVGILEGDSFVTKKTFPYQASIKCFSASNNTFLWIGSTVGLLQFNKVLLHVDRVFTTHDGLSNQYIYGVLPDKDRLWISTNAGINCLQPGNGIVKSFNAGDGLQSNEFNTYSFCKTAAGELVFGGVNGLNAFFPSTVQSYSYKPQLQLSALQINDEPYAAEGNVGELKEMKLKPFENTLGFQFTVLDFANPASNRLFYRLKGYDNNWIGAANKSAIRYANLPPGEYTLEAKAINAENMESNTVYSLAITVEKPWWKTWWARLVFCFVLAVFLYWAIRNYLRSQLRQQQVIMEKELAIEQERTKMARELHDGLGSKLSGIKHSFAAFKHSLELPSAQNEVFDQNIDKLNESILELRNLSHSLSAELSLQHGLAHALRDYCNSIRDSGVLAVTFNSLQPATVSLTADQSFHIYRIVQELLQNVIRHARATTAIVQLSYHNKKLVITVEDDGKGFDIHKHEQEGIGISNIQARIRLLQGSIAYNSIPGEGTTVDIEIPVD